MTCESFFIALYLDKDGDPKGHAVSQTLERLDATPTAPAEGKEENVTPSGEATTFAAVFDGFASVITTYRDFLKFIIQFAPMMSRALAERKIGDFVKTKGKKRDELSNSARVV